VKLSPSAARVLRRLLQAPPALVLLVAALLKASDPAEFAYQIRAYEMIPPGLSAAAAFFFIAVEVGLAAALLADARPRLVLPATAALFVGFIGVVGVAWSLGRTEQCGCFGTLVQRTPAETLAEDFALLALVGAAWLLLRAAPAKRPGRTAVPLAGAAAGIALAIALPRLPVDDLTTSLRPGATMSHLDPEMLDVDLLRGEHFVAIWETGCGRCLGDLPRLEAIAATGLHVVALFPETNENVMAFFLEHGPGFDLAAMPRAALKPYYRTLPVYWLLRDGRAARIWRGAAPEAGAL
jgi:hypothetical protein